MLFRQPASQELSRKEPCKGKPSGVCVEAGSESKIESPVGVWISLQLPGYPANAQGEQKEDLNESHLQRD
jgi:hypothetical protein